LKNKYQIFRIFNKSWNDELNDDEEKYLMEWLETSPKNRDLYERLTQAYITKHLQQYEENIQDECESQSANDSEEQNEENVSPKKGIRISKSVCWVIASVSVAACIFLIIYLHNTAPTGLLDISNKVVLRLSDRTPILPEMVNEPLMLVEGHYQLMVQKNEVRYQPQQDEVIWKNEDDFNEISTPTGRLYKVIFPDGSEILLGSCSSIRFSVGEGDKIRSLELRGMAYFKINSLYVGKNKAPFVVKVKSPGGLNQEVTVTGTTFNINAYGDESVIKTTLLEGRIKVASKDEITWLSSGEELHVGKKGHRRLRSHNRDAIAWKDGLFLFNDAPFQHVVKELGRWYGRRIVFYGDTANRVSFVAPRTKDLDSLLSGICRSISCEVIKDENRLLIIEAR
jgi:transmembrane sensor